jgi:hypothetical protein
MNEEEDNNKIKGTVEAVTGLVKALPVYQDAVQPAAKEIGKTLETVAKTVNVALMPLKGFVWSFEQLQNFIDTKIAGKLKSTPENEIDTPPSNVVVPALQAISYSGDQPELQELFANLVAASMDKSTRKLSHPSFVETIKQLTPDEAKLLNYFLKEQTLPLLTIRNNKQNGSGGHDAVRNFSLLGFKAGCDNPEITPVALDNLGRLGIIHIPKDYHYSDKEVYNELHENKEVKEAILTINLKENRKSKIIEGMVQITDFGEQFINICVKDHSEYRK